MSTAAPVQRLFLDAAAVAVEVTSRPEVTTAWDLPSALAGMSVGALAAHTTRAITRAEEFLNGPDPRDTATIDAGPYYAALPGVDDPDSEINRGVLQRAIDEAAPGPDAVEAETRACLRRLPGLLAAQPAGRRVLVRGGYAMTLDEYLRSRLIELAVHLDDLTASVPMAPTGLPDEIVLEAARALLGTAAARHGATTVLRALARRERADPGALRAI